MACNFDPDVTINDGSCEYVSCSGCMDDRACNFDELATIPSDCTYLDGVCQTYENGLIIDNDIDQDGVCDIDDIGCLDEIACNYDPGATSDGNCIYAENNADCNGLCLDSCILIDNICVVGLPGCIDPSACNYSIDSNNDDGSCIYVDGVCETCENGVIIDNDFDNDGVCDENEIFGCADENACNFDNLATEDDNSCEYETCVVVWIQLPVITV